jgi:hypothetical protein
MNELTRQLIAKLEQEIVERRELIASLRSSESPTPPAAVKAAKKAPAKTAPKKLGAWSPARRKKFSATMKRVLAAKKAGNTKGA